MERSSKTSHLEICSACKGEACIWVIESLPRHGSDKGHEVAQMCPECQGTGIVKIVTETTITTYPHFIPLFKSH